jgi:arylsulfatase A-like enzyme
VGLTTAAAPQVRNVLFIMADQLRADMLSCYRGGAGALQTPNLDALAARGTRFDHCYVQGTVCGPSRMSTYTGRYVSSHGATWNFVPLSVHLPTMGDHLRQAGLRVAVIGKTHVVADRAGMARLGLDPASPEGVLVGQGGFEPYARDDGVLPDGKLAYGDTPYNRYLKAQGYDARNAWHDFANAAAGPLGQVLSGWQMRHAGLPARVDERHSETAWTTDRAIDFIREQGGSPWCLHLSYIKPHWPYIAPAPYHRRFTAADVPAAVRSQAERDGAHPVLEAFRQHPESLAFAREEVRRTVVPAYMGLVQQLDDHIGRLLRALEELGRRGDTLVVFTADHGDLLGDHWLGEKELFYEPSVRVPLIVADPAGAGGRVSDALVEAIDLLPTFREAVGLPADDAWLEGRSLLPLLRGGAYEEREAACSELDYAFYAARQALGLDVNAARATMVRTRRWKYVRFEGFRPQLFDLAGDPHELRDLGASADHADVRCAMAARLAAWRAGCRTRVTLSDAQVRACGDRTRAGGVRIGEW